MAKIPQAKVIVDAETSGLHKKMKGAKTAVKDFESTTNKALESVGDAFGVNTQQVEKLISSVRGLGVKLQESGNAGAKALGSLLTNTSALGAGLAGLGLAGVVAGFKLLNEEATAFKNTVQGAHIDMMTEAYVSTYKQVLHDFNEETGRNVAQAEANWKKTWNEFLANLSYTISSGGFTGFESILGGVIKAVVPKNEGTEQARAAATEAERLAKRMFDLQRMLSDKTVEWAQEESKIAEYKRIAYDKTQSLATQQENVNKAAALISERYREEAKIRKQIADIQAQMNDLSSSSIADVEKANQLRIAEMQTMTRMDNALRELSERQKSIADNAAKEAEARKKALEYAQAIAKSRQDLAAWGNLSQPSEISMPKAEAMSMPGIAVKVTPELDTDAAIDISKELEMMMASSFETTGQLVGQLIGDLATGGDAWKNFSSSAISAFGDMAISVGKMAIQTGTATLGIKAALETLNPWVAIAAGTALVALGTAVKSSLSNIASGNYSATSSVASAVGSGSSSSSINNSFTTKEMNIKVTGVLTGSGSTLKAVIENESKRTNRTT